MIDSQRLDDPRQQAAVELGRFDAQIDDMSPTNPLKAQHVDIRERRAALVMHDVMTGGLEVRAVPGLLQRGREEFAQFMRRQGYNAEASYRL